MRNGDYTPTRLEAQQDAVNIICATKTQSNPESTVAVMTMAQTKNGAKAEVLVSLTQDVGRLLSSVASLKIGGEIDFSAALQVSQLILKHRQNKNQHQRIISFVGSPIKETSDELVKLGKKLKKNNIAVDIVNFGEEAENVEKLEAFIKAVNTGEESHLITVPAGPHILSDILVSSPIIAGEGGGAFGADAMMGSMARARAGNEFDFDPNDDPELALVIRMSIEEEKARQEEAKRKSEQEKGGAPSVPPTSSVPSGTQDVVMGNSDEDDELQMALAMSMRETASTKSTESKEEMADDELALALEMSNSTPSTSSNTNPPSSSSSDDDFLKSVLGSLPGVDTSDERVRDALKNLEKKDEKKK